MDLTPSMKIRPDSISRDVHALARRSPSITLAEHERQPDMKRLRGYRLARVQAELGKHDYAGAAAAWETLVKTNPGYPEMARVQSLISDARQKPGATE